MAVMATGKQVSALQRPWHAKRAKAGKMLRTSTPCSSSQASQGTSILNKENLRRQIVGLAVKRDSEGDRGSRFSETSASTPSPEVKKRHLSSSNQISTTNNTSAKSGKHRNPPRRTRIYAPASDDMYGNKMPNVEPHEALRKAMRRSRTIDVMDTKSKPKIVRFRMDEVTIGTQQTPIVTITDIAKPVNGHDSKSDTEQPCEVRGNAISVRQEGLKGLLAYKDLCSGTEKRQTSFQSSLRLFRRRLKLNQEKFIQPNETTTEDYVIHPRSPFPEVHSPVPQQADDRPASRPVSSTDHVRILRSALQNKHNGGPIVKQTDAQDMGESQNIKCSYRLPENPNWGKEVSFKDMKDDSIPNVKTYVLEEDRGSHSKFRKNRTENAVTLNTHNLNVHNSITQVNGQKIKLGDTEISFDPRFLDWLEESLSNVKTYKTMSIISDDTSVDGSLTSSAKRRVYSKT